MQNITFQLVLASGSNKTFALLLYNGTYNDPNCNPLVVTGFKAGIIIIIPALNPLVVTGFKAGIIIITMILSLPLTISSHRHNRLPAFHTVIIGYYKHCNRCRI